MVKRLQVVSYVLCDLLQIALDFFKPLVPMRNDRASVFRVHHVHCLNNVPRETERQFLIVDPRCGYLLADALVEVEELYFGVLV
jgi:hypothetical protein